MFRKVKILDMIFFSFPDGETSEKISYRWKSPEGVQFASHLFLKDKKLSSFREERCDVMTRTGMQI